MRTEAQQLGHPLVGADRVEHDPPRRRIRHSLIQVSEQERRSLDAHQVCDIEASGPEFGAKLTRPISLIDMSPSRPSTSS